MNENAVRSEPAVAYRAVINPEDDAVIRQARQIMNYRVASGTLFDSPKVSHDFMVMQLGTEEREFFCVAFLNNRHNLISFEHMFAGTIASARVYPREVVKRALELNAASVIFAHNHPSGVAEPSRDDEDITRRLRDALALVEVRALDHIIVGGGETVSLAERGII